MAKGERRLPVKIEAYQNQCWVENNYTGFQCPENNPKCSIKKGDTANDALEAFKIIGGLIELDHLDQCRFSATGTTLAEQVVVRCHECHTQRHANDASASRIRFE